MPVCSIQPRMRMVILLMLSQWMLSFILLPLDGNSSLPLSHHLIIVEDGPVSLVLFLWSVYVHLLLVTLPTSLVAVFKLRLPLLLSLSLPLEHPFQILSPQWLLLFKTNLLIQHSVMLLAQTLLTFSLDLVFHGSWLFTLSKLTIQLLSKTLDIMYQLVLLDSVLLFSLFLLAHVLLSSSVEDSLLEENSVEPNSEEPHPAPSFASSGLSTSYYQLSKLMALWGMLHSVSTKLRFIEKKNAGLLIK